MGASIKSIARRYVNRARIRLNRYARNTKIIVGLYRLIVISILTLRQSHEIEKHGRTVDLRLMALTLRLDISRTHDYNIYRRLKKGRFYEQGTTNLIQQNLTTRSTFVDVGANNGYFTLIAANSIGPHGEIISFEPGPSAYPRLETNVKINNLSNVKLHRIAVSNYVGKGKLFMSIIEDARDSLHRTTLLHSGRFVQVDVTTLDEALADKKVDIVKIDVEGSEQAVIEGMRNQIAKNPDIKIVAEWNRTYSNDAWLETIREWFEIYQIVDDKRGYRLKKINSPSDLPWICNLWLEKKGTPSAVT